MIFCERDASLYIKYNFLSVYYAGALKQKLHFLLFETFLIILHYPVTSHAKIINWRLLVVYTKMRFYTFPFIKNIENKA